MARMFGVEQEKLIKAVSEDLRKTEGIKPPKWAPLAKTGAHKERPPADSDWWYVRAAAILRSVYRLGPVGVQKLRKKYGGKRSRGVGAEKFCKGSGNIARKVLQQLEAAGLVAKKKKGVYSGRVVTGKGHSLLDRAALRIGGKPEKTVAAKNKEQAAEKKTEAAPKKEPEKKKEAQRRGEKKALKEEQAPAEEKKAKPAAEKAK